MLTPTLEAIGAQAMTTPQTNIDVFSQRFGPDGQGQTKGNLGARREPGGGFDGKAESAQQSFPNTGHIAMADEPDPAELGGTNSQDHRNTTCCPVPWLPPAGGTGDATMCSMPYPVQTPQS